MGLPEVWPLLTSYCGPKHGLLRKDLLVQHLLFFEKHVFLRLRHEDLLLRRLPRCIAGKGQVLRPDKEVSLVFQEVDILVGQKEIVVKFFDPRCRLELAAVRAWPAGFGMSRSAMSPFSARLPGKRKLLRG